MLARNAISAEAGHGFDTRPMAVRAALTSTIITIITTTTGSPGGGTDMV